MVEAYLAPLDDHNQDVELEVVEVVEHQSLAILGLQDQYFEVKSRALLEPRLHSGLSALAAAVVRKPIADFLGKPTEGLHLQHRPSLGSSLHWSQSSGLIDISGLNTHTHTRSLHHKRLFEYWIKHCTWCLHSRTFKLRMTNCLIEQCTQTN